MKYANVGLLAYNDTLPSLTQETKLSENQMVNLKKSLAVLAYNLRGNTSREEYFLWRTAWRKVYREVGDFLVGLKCARDGKTQGVGGNVYETIRPLRQSDVMKVRRYAHHLMILRTMSKIHAGRNRAKFLANSVRESD